MMMYRFAQSIINSGEVNIPQGALNDGSVRSALQLIFGFAGSLAVLIIVVAGLRYVTSTGDPKSAAKSRSAIIFAVVGLVISAIAYSIVTFVVGRL
jgi:type IV secretory pathway VirB2 component (pilin)